MRGRALAFAVIAFATSAFAVLATGAGTAAQSPSPNDASSARALVQRYLATIRDRRYNDAFALLESKQRAYFRTAANFASGFEADGATLDAFAIAGVRGATPERVVFVRERIALDDPANDVRVTTVLTVPYLVVGRGSSARIGEGAGRPWRAFAANASARSGGMRVTVKKVAFDEHDVRVIVTMQNDGVGFVTVLPYGRSVLRDDAGAIYRPIVSRDWTMTDRRLFLGLRLAADSRYTGALAFASPALDDRAHRFTLTLGPIVRDGASAPFSIDVAGVSARD